MQEARQLRNGVRGGEPPHLDPVECGAMRGRSGHLAMTFRANAIAARLAPGCARFRADVAEQAGIQLAQGGPLVQAGPWATAGIPACLDQRFDQDTPRPLPGHGATRGDECSGTPGMDRGAGKGRT